MTFDRIKEAVLEMSPEDQKRVILELVPEIWPQVCVDDSCLDRMRELVDEAVVREYREQHFNNV
ncbi:hypothetical protein SAMN02746041_02107 [Desulfacinum hydrothermale DSM 13146]|uniref:Addiction module component n=1 Tax=Desulfacinum hydrothermale DSM 13146 TaxID=1121390 RepID=A0A1W1XMT4_9BACT|nr:hypothetical protein [Desulfacinum hydrothermale]SMC24841.1 hypothetical protein SAMN02746041_02107 [Desulfacinum hydrothermale DSM 13146]